MESITLSESASEVGIYAFSNNEKLSMADFGSSSLNSIPEGLFCNCTSLEAIIFPANIDLIGPESFKKTKLPFVKFPETVLDVGKSAFSECYNLQEVDLSKTNIVKVKESTFSKCSKLAKVQLPSSLRIIGSASFALTNIQEIAFPSTLTVIGSASFAYCSNLQKIILSNTIIKAIKQSAFEGCLNLDEIDLPTSLANVGQQIFLGCSKLSKIKYGGLNDLESEQYLPNDVEISLPDLFTGSRFLGHDVHYDKVK